MIVILGIIKTVPSLQFSLSLWESLSWLTWITLHADESANTWTDAKSRQLFSSLSIEGVPAGYRSSWSLLLLVCMLVQQHDSVYLPSCLLIASVTSMSIKCNGIIASSSVCNENSEPRRCGSLIADLIHQMRLIRHTDTLIRYIWLRSDDYDVAVKVDTLLFFIAVSELQRSIVWVCLPPGCIYMQIEMGLTVRNSVWQDHTVISVTRLGILNFQVDRTCVNDSRLVSLQISWHWWIQIMVSCTADTHLWSFCLASQNSLSRFRIIRS